MSDDLLALVREASPHLLRAGPETETWMTRLGARHDELHGLVEELLASDPSAAADACAGLWPFWWQRGHMAEGRMFLERASVAALGPAPDLREVASS